MVGEVRGEVWCGRGVMIALFCFLFCFFFFQAEDGIRDTSVTGVQTCALPIYFGATYHFGHFNVGFALPNLVGYELVGTESFSRIKVDPLGEALFKANYRGHINEIGRASCRERV